MRSEGVSVANWMIDIESLGTRSGSVILSIGLVRFDGDGLHEARYLTIDVLSSLFAGCTIDRETVAWWASQSPEAKHLISKQESTLESALGMLDSLIKKVDLVWAKGPDFDLTLLHNAYRLLGRKPPWLGRNTRCVRTLLAVGRLFDAEISFPFVGIRHFALDDAKRQALQVIAVYKAMGKLLE
mgnify:CR=1 FL=1